MTIPIVRTPIAEATVHVVPNVRLVEADSRDYDVAVIGPEGEMPIGIQLDLDDACDLAITYGCEHKLHVWVAGEPYFAPGGSTAASH